MSKTRQNEKQLKKLKLQTCNYPLSDCVNDGVP